jgi:hypothetical protein
MPYVNIQTTKGATRDKKKHLVADVTASLVNRLGKSPDTSPSSFRKSRGKTGVPPEC